MGKSERERENRATERLEARIRAERETWRYAESVFKYLAEY